MSSYCSGFLLSEIEWFILVVFEEFAKLFLLLLVDHSEDTSDRFANNTAI